MSEISGGKFSNGAVTGAFVHMFNAENDTLFKGLTTLKNKIFDGTIGGEIKRGYDNSHPMFKGVLIVASAPTIGVLSVAAGSAVLRNSTTRSIAEGLYGAEGTNPGRLIGRGIKKVLEDQF